MWRRKLVCSQILALWSCTLVTCEDEGPTLMVGAPRIRVTHVSPAEGARLALSTWWDAGRTGAGAEDGDFEPSPLLEVQWVLDLGAGTLVVSQVSEWSFEEAAVRGYDDWVTVPCGGAESAGFDAVLPIVRNPWISVPPSVAVEDALGAEYCDVWDVCLAGLAVRLIGQEQPDGVRSWFVAYFSNIGDVGDRPMTDVFTVECGQTECVRKSWSMLSVVGGHTGDFKEGDTVLGEIVVAPTDVGLGEGECWTLVGEKLCTADCESVACLAHGDLTFVAR